MVTRFLFAHGKPKRKTDLNVTWNSPTWSSTTQVTRHVTLSCQGGLACERTMHLFCVCAIAWQVLSIKGALSRVKEPARLTVELQDIDNKHKIELANPNCQVFS